MSQLLNLTVMLGGPSAEREVSLRSGQSVAQALRSLGHRIHELDPQTDDWFLPPGTDAVFLVLHGTYGEDGTVQQRLEQLGVPYTGCDPESSRVAFDKLLTKKRCLEAAVPTPRFFVVDTPDAEWPQDWEPPVVLKPVRQGSSVGLQFVDRIEDWQPALREALKFDQEILVEERVIGREVTVGILDHQALPIVEVRPKQGRYDYANKYTPGATEYLCPAPLDDQVTQRLHQLARATFQALGCRDYARVDAMIPAAGEPLVLEVNTLPGMTETSLLPKAAAAAGISYEALCQRMVDLAVARRR